MDGGADEVRYLADGSRVVLPAAFSVTVESHRATTEARRQEVRSILGMSRPPSVLLYDRMYRPVRIPATLPDFERVTADAAIAC